MWGYAIIAIICAFLLKIYYPRLRGGIGEHWVREELSRLDQQFYKIINDYLFRVGDQTIQIDHLVISCYGIFVIETKTYDGWLFGNNSGRPWVQMFYRYKGSVVNPISQNYGHIQGLKKCIGEIGINIEPRGVVVLAGAAKLKNGPISGVVYLKDLESIIGSYVVPVMTADTRDQIYNYLESIRLVGKEFSKEHVHSVRLRREHYQADLRAGVCPRCHGRLIEKRGRFGPFFGCENYSKTGCKYILKQSRVR